MSKQVLKTLQERGLVDTHLNQL